MRLNLALTICAAVAVLSAPSSVLAEAHYSLAFQRQLPAWENSAGEGCVGGHVCRAWVFDEAGQPVPNIRLMTSWNVEMGRTDSDGRAEIPINMGDDFDLLCDDGTTASSDIARVMTSDRPDCWGHYSFEVAFLYKTSIDNPGTFDLDLNGTWNEPRPPVADVDVPYTKSLAYNGCDWNDYWSDQSTWGGWQNPPSYFGQTFVATGDRVVAARVQGIIGGNDLLSWKLRIVEFPSLTPVGPDTEVPVRWPFGWEAFWGVNDCPVVAGHTYMLQVWRDPGGMNIYHVMKNVYPQGQYYEGTQAFADRDLNGHVVCMTYGSSGGGGEQISPDLNEDGVVNLGDVAMLAGSFSSPASTPGRTPDLAGDDGRIDCADLAVIASRWLEYIDVLAYWKFDESSGTTASDSAGDHDATVYGSPQWLAEGGKAHGALLLDGVDDYAAAPFVLDPSQTSLSVFAWIKGGQPGQSIISQQGGTSQQGVAGYDCQWLAADSTGGCLMTALNSPGRYAKSLMSSTVITDGNWHRVGLTWDGQFRSLYVDDRLVARDADAQDGLCKEFGQMHLGASATLSAGGYFAGLLDDVVIYGRCVNP